MKNIHEMTRKEFYAVQKRKRYNDELGQISSFVLLPTRKKHNSGWGLIEVVAVIGDRPVCKATQCSDDIEIQLGQARIDLLPKSGLFHIWCYKTMWCGSALSSFEIKEFVDKLTDKKGKG